MSEAYNPGDYNRGGMITFMFSMIVTMVFFVYVGFVHKGVDLKEIPNPDQIEKQEGAAPAASEESTDEGEGA